jgi:hypothetical protein
MKPTLIYTAFLMVFGVFYEWLNSKVRDIVFIVIVLVYGVSARVVAEKYGRGKQW